MSDAASEAKHDEKIGEALKHYERPWGPAELRASFAVRGLSIIATAERDALVEALKKIAGGFINTDFVMAVQPNWHSAFNQLQQIATAALAEAS